MPPRNMKSLAVSVFWPAWHWLHNPGSRFLSSSYAQALSIRDARKNRLVVQHPYYRKIARQYLPDFDLVGDQNQKSRFENSYGGSRLATSVESYLTGEGGDIIIIDDPHNVAEGNSATKRLAVLQWWDESMSTRVNDADSSAVILVMQRIHERDLTGHLLAKEMNWDHLCLPARYEGKDGIQTNLVNWHDPRTVLDEVLWPERYNDEALATLEKDMGSYAVAGQLQQRPAPRGGGMFKVENFKLISGINPEDIVDGVRYWDKAGTEGGGKRTSGVLFLKHRKGHFIIADVVKGQWSFMAREARIKQCAKLDDNTFPNFDVKIWHEQEPGSGGKESAERTTMNLAGYVVHADRVTGDKVTRAEPYSAQVEAGNVYVINKEWTKDFIDEHELFPSGSFKDQVDGASGAFNKLTGKKKRAGGW